MRYRHGVPGMPAWYLYFKITFTLAMFLVFIWALISYVVDGRSREGHNGANSLTLHTIELELLTLEINPKLNTVTRRVKLERLAKDYSEEIEKDPDDPVLQAKGLILAAESGVDLSQQNEFLQGETGRNGLLKTTGMIYSSEEQDLPISQLEEHLGKNWFTLKALIHHAEKTGESALEVHYQNNLLMLAYSQTRKFMIWSFFLFAVLGTGIILWFRFFIKKRNDLPVKEKILERTHWNLLDGLFVFLLFFWIMTAVTYLLEPWLDLLEKSAGVGLYFIPVLYLLQAITGLILLQSLFFRRGWLQIMWIMGLFGQDVKWGKTIRWGIGGYAATMPLVIASVYVVSKVLQVDPVSTNPMIPFIIKGDSMLVKISFALTIGILAPIFEEIFFRGFLFNSIRANIGAPGGMILSSLLFALVHFDFSVFFGLFAIGLMLSFVYQQTQSLVPSIILHSLWNSTTMVSIQLLFGGSL